MRAIKIDSENRTITEIDIDSARDGYLGMKEVVGGIICTAYHYPDRKATCFVNDEGLLNNPQHFFLSKYYPQPLAGNAIIVGTRGPETVECKLNLQEVIDTTKFFTLAEVQKLIRVGLVNFDTTVTSMDTGITEVTQKIDLGAFDKKED